MWQDYYILMKYKKTYKFRQKEASFIYYEEYGTYIFFECVQKTVNDCSEILVSFLKANADSRIYKLGNVHII